VKEPQPKAFDTEIDVGFNDPPSDFLEEHRSALRIPIDHRINYRSPLALIHVAWTAYNIIDAVEDDYSNSITIKLGDVITSFGDRGWFIRE
jgi:hypothetical protein